MSKLDPHETARCGNGEPGMGLSGPELSAKPSYWVDHSRRPRKRIGVLHSFVEAIVGSARNSWHCLPWRRSWIAIAALQLPPLHLISSRPARALSPASASHCASRISSSSISAMQSSQLEVPARFSPFPRLQLAACGCWSWDLVKTRCIEFSTLECVS